MSNTAYKQSNSGNNLTSNSSNLFTTKTSPFSAVLQTPNLKNNFISSERVLTTKVSEWEGKVKVKCPNCDSQFIQKNEYVAHYKTCANLYINNPNEENSILNNQFSQQIVANKAMINQFYQSQENLQNKTSNFIFNKIDAQKNMALTNLEQLENSIRVKQENIDNIDKKLKNKNTLEDFIKDDPELRALIEEESKLLEQKKNLIQIFNDNNEEIKMSRDKNENRLREATEIFRSNLMLLELEEKWVSEELESSFFNYSTGDVCGLCKGAQGETVKFSCQICRSKYCMNKCAKKQKKLIYVV
jgi:uncharacterized C2H2 Zn-finger protein